MLVRSTRAEGGGLGHGARGLERTSPQPPSPPTIRTNSPPRAAAVEPTVPMRPQTAITSLASSPGLIRPACLRAYAHGRVDRENARELRRVVGGVPRHESGSHHDQALPRASGAASGVGETSIVALHVVLASALAALHGLVATERSQDGWGDKKNGPAGRDPHRERRPALGGQREGTRVPT